MLIWRVFMVRRRSSGSLGRIEIRSSSEESQFNMFRTRSRLPLNRRKLLATHREEPTTTNLPFPFSFPVVYVPAAPITSGPFLSFLPSLISGDARLVVAKLLSLVENSFSTVVLLPFLTSRERAMG